MFEGPARIEYLPLAPERRVLVIADVHGNLPYLRGVLELAGFGDGDLVIFDGDFLEKGPQSLETLRFIMRLCAEGRARAVCGNCDGWSDIFSLTPEQERHALDYLAWRRCGLVWDMCRELGLDPLAGDFSACKAALREAYAPEWAFLAALPHAIETENYLFSHSGVLAGKPLAEHTAAELIKFDDFLSRAGHFSKWLIVGHWPVMLYHESIVDANPIIDRERHIVSIDGGCVLKDDGQLNALVLPRGEGEDFSFFAYDPFPTARVKSDQPGGGRSYYIRWGDSRVRVLRRGEEFSLCRHLRTGYEMEILTKYLFTDEEITGCNDSTDYVLPLKAGDEVRIVERTSRGYLVKHNGVSGWYFGELEED
ncbi:MAG: metallophosphoesterase [Oscillospiraceae bacterium]|nr:metallophosphoesterase [Oscillospiraceae bacterium]